MQRECSSEALRLIFPKNVVEGLIKASFVLGKRTFELIFLLNILYKQRYKKDMKFWLFSRYCVIYVSFVCTYKLLNKIDTQMNMLMMICLD